MSTLRHTVTGIVLFKVRDIVVVAALGAHGFAAWLVLDVKDCHVDHFDANGAHVESLGLDGFPAGSGLRVHVAILTHVYPQKIGY